MYSGTLRNVASLSRRRFNGKRKPVILTFTSSATWIVPAGVTKVDAFLVGGGGSGGSGATLGTLPDFGSYLVGGGTGGGGGFYARTSLNVTPGASMPVIVGSASGSSSFGGVTVLSGENGSSPTYNSGTGGYSNNNSPGNGGSDGGYCGTSNSMNGLHLGIGGLADQSQYAAYGITPVDFNNIAYSGGGGAGGGGYGTPTPITRAPGVGLDGAGNGGAMTSYTVGAVGGPATANSGSGGGGGAARQSSGLGGGAGGSGLVQIRYWKE